MNEGINARIKLCLTRKTLYVTSFCTSNYFYYAARRISYKYGCLQKSRSLTQVIYFCTVTAILPPKYAPG